MTYRVRIRWSDFISYEDALTRDSDYTKTHKGIYYIYQKTKDSELISYYIGKSADSFYARLHDHRVNPKHRITYIYHDKYVQLASIQVEGSISFQTYKDVLDDIESILIFSVNAGRDLPKNKSKVNSINIGDTYIIHNDGYLPAGVCSHMEAKMGKYIMRG